MRDFSEIIGDEAETTAAAAATTTTSPPRAEEWETRVPESSAVKMELPVRSINSTIYCSILRPFLKTAAFQFFVQPPLPSRPPSPPPPPPLAASSSTTSSTPYYCGLEPSLSQNHHLSSPQPQPSSAAASAFFPAAEPNSSGAFAVGQNACDSPHQNQAIQCSLCGWNFDNENFLQLHQGRLR